MSSLWEELTVHTAFGAQSSRGVAIRKTRKHGQSLSTIAKRLAHGERTARVRYAGGGYDESAIYFSR